MENKMVSKKVEKKAMIKKKESLQLKTMVDSPKVEKVMLLLKKNQRRILLQRKAMLLLKKAKLLQREAKNQLRNLKKREPLKKKWPQLRGHLKVLIQETLY